MPGSGTEALVPGATRRGTRPDGARPARPLFRDEVKEHETRISYLSVRDMVLPGSFIVIDGGEIRLRESSVR